MNSLISPFPCDIRTNQFSFRCCVRGRSVFGQAFVGEKLMFAVNKPSQVQVGLKRGGFHKNYYHHDKTAF